MTGWLSNVLEAIAVALIAVLVAATAGAIWGLLPIAVYLLIVAAGLSARDRK